jgi:N-methylhydantoinase A
VSDVVKDYSRTLLWRLAGTLPQAKLEKEFRKLEAAAQKEFHAEHWLGSLRPGITLEFERSLDLRYRGQGYELNVSATNANNNAANKDTVIARFHKEHQRRYGYHHPGRDIELVTVRLRARLRTEKVKFHPTSTQKKTARKPASTVAPVERAPVFFQNKALTTPVFERGDLHFAREMGRQMKGPAIITEYSATTVIPPRKKFWVDTTGNLIIKIK